MAERPWYKDVDKAYVERCRALAAEIWPDKADDARESHDDEEEDADDPLRGIAVCFILNRPGYVELQIDDMTVIDEVRLERLEPALLALRGPKEASDG